MRIASIIIFLAVVSLAGCGQNGTTLAPVQGDKLNAPELLELGGKMVSGVPEGIFVQWTRNTEPNVAGYYLYRDTQPIPTPPPDETIDPLLRTNGGSMIAQPPSGASVSFTDIFSVAIGTTYYYRVTAVDTDGNESYPSNQVSWLVHGQTVSGLSPLQAYWGDDVTLTGDTFGTYNDTTDHVLFQTVDGNTLEGNVVSWNDTQIVATIPDDAITGPVYVVVGGTIASTDDELQILNPFITDVTPAVGFVEQPIVVTGANFGSDAGSSTVAIGSTDVTAAVTSWDETRIELVPFDGIADGQVRVTVGGLTSNGITFRPRPEILSVSRSSAAPGAEITIDGRYFTNNTGGISLGGASQPLTGWGDRQITFIASRTPGTYPLLVSRFDGLLSNDVAFEMLPPLAISISGIDPAVLYTPANAPQLLFDFPDDTDRIVLQVGLQTILDVTDPSGKQLTLPVESIFNGRHDVQATAYGRGVTADSNVLSGLFLSLSGDTNADGLVDNGDITWLLGVIGLTSADSGYRHWYDTDGDGLVTEADASMIGYSFGNTLEPLPF